MSESENIKVNVKFCDFQDHHVLNYKLSQNNTNKNTKAVYDVCWKSSESNLFYNSYLCQVCTNYLYDIVSDQPNNYQIIFCNYSNQGFG